MARPTLLSDGPRSSEPAAAPSSTAAPLSEAARSEPARSGVQRSGMLHSAAPPPEPPPSDLAAWLTRDLRVKGAPSERPPAERPSQPHAVVITESKEPELASWLLQDLKPRSSVPPEALNATLLASKWESAVPPAPPPSGSPPAAEAPVPPDSLVPHAVSEAPAALAPRDTALEEEDLAVLPSHRRKKRDWRKLVVLAALASVGGAVLWVTSGSQADELTDAAAAAAAAPAVLTAPLPPPPPSEAEALPPPDEPESEAPAAPSGQRSPVSSAEPAPDDEALYDIEPGRRGRRAGEAVARFADLPSPTLSRLAREKRERARQAAQGRASAKPGASDPEP